MACLLLLNVIRTLVLTVSIIGLCCHMIQCIMLSNYQKEAHLTDWLQAGHWQYLAWYMSFALSTLCAAIVCVGACWTHDPKARCDRFLGILNTLPLFTSLLTESLADTTEPWTNNGDAQIKRPITSIITYCLTLDARKDVSYPLLYNRCLLSDATWIAATLACALWAALALVAFCQRPPQPVKGQLPTVEPTWGRHIPDFIYSPASLPSDMPLVPAPNYPASHKDYALTYRSSLLRQPYDQYYLHSKISLESHGTMIQSNNTQYDHAEKYRGYQPQSPMSPQTEKLELYDNYPMSPNYYSPLDKGYTPAPGAEGWLECMAPASPFVTPLAASTTYTERMSYEPYPSNHHSSSRQSWLPSPRP
ncbi:uncharacterized protein BYT42DRAFT_648624 [Radiomyces spectabilis]|uniref:uncharacterized protein n=1 Tax=Radiomyces spectabilis TaxID=64574 RepID=UPI00221FBA24|nr:uncharacterized protein BYT42DRAFT_648624 [Radiomyces spectabilis]KAI8367612.1 hypothetical protein BYT42DRAFT_648624 [Radiomyces spectabilis]